MNNIKKIFTYNKYIIILLFIYFILGISVTYAYLAFQKENNSVITDNVIAIDVELEIDLIVGTNDDMVPLNGEALNNALNGIGSTNGACIDNVGNLSCQVYKITLNNKGSRLRHINGTIELYAKDGSNNVFNNLMWRELSTPTTIKEDAIFNTMEKSTLVSDMTIESKDVKVWYIAVWINDINQDQLNTDKGDFAGTVTFESFEVHDNTFVEEIMKQNAQSDENIDFNLTSSGNEDDETDDTNGIYLRNETENNTYPIYYYRGNVNNNLIFANFCWKVVRSTDTGGLKLLYNGTPTENQCNNTSSSTHLGYKKYNSSTNSIAYVGYMYSNPYASKSKTMSNTTIIYGNDVTYKNGTYTLENTITSSNWTDIYNEGLNNNHYTCFSTNNTCTTVYYIYFTNPTKAYYIELTNGKKVEDALKIMLGTNDSKIKSYNTTSNSIKGNNTTSETLDYWYYTNIKQKGYNNYIKDTIWYNDRGIYDYAG